VLLYEVYDPIGVSGRCDGTETGLFAGGKIQYDGVGHWIGSLCHRSLGNGKGRHASECDGMRRTTNYGEATGASVAQASME